MQASEVNKINGLFVSVCVKFGTFVLAVCQICAKSGYISDGGVSVRITKKATLVAAFRLRTGHHQQRLT
jgi:hypothetical protein